MLSAFFRILVEMGVHLYIVPLDIAIGRGVRHFVTLIIPAFIISLFFKKSNKVVVNKAEVPVEILDADL